MRALLTCVAGALLVAVPAGASAFTGPTVRLSADDGAEYRAPRLALNGAGDAVAASVRAPAAARPGAGRVTVAERTRRGRWSPGRTLPGRAAGAPAAAINARGQAVLAWGADAGVYVATRSGRAAGWRTAVAATARGGAVRDVAAAIDARGAILLLWAERAGRGFRIRAALRPAGRARWQAHRGRLTAGARPALLAGPGRAGLAMWRADGWLWAAHTTGRGFERPVRLAGHDPESPAVARSRAGTLAAWGARLPGGTVVLAGAERRMPGARWRALGDLGVGAAPKVGANGRGDAIIAWASADDGRAGVEAAVRRRGGGWAPTTINPPGRCECRYELGGATVDADGGLAVSWRRRDAAGDGAAAIATRSAAGGRWRIRRVVPVPDYGPPGLAAPAGAAAGAIWATSGHDGGVRARIRSGAGHAPRASAAGRAPRAPRGAPG